MLDDNVSPTATSFVDTAPAAEAATYSITAHTADVDGAAATVTFDPANWAYLMNNGWITTWLVSPHLTGNGRRTAG